MSASEEIKKKGLPSLQYVSEISHVPRNTLHLWYKDKYERFNVIVEGVKAIKEKEDNQ